MNAKDTRRGFDECGAKPTAVLGSDLCRIAIKITYVFVLMSACCFCVGVFSFCLFMLAFIIIFESAISSAFVDFYIFL